MDKHNLRRRPAPAQAIPPPTGDDLPRTSEVQTPASGVSAGTRRGSGKAAGEGPVHHNIAQYYSTFSLIAATQNCENEYEDPDSPIHHSRLQ